jgi:hypothetical protein
MRRIFTILAVFLMVGTFAAAQTKPAAQAEKPKATKAAKAPAAPKAQKVVGATVVSADASNLTIKAAKGEMKFALTADTKIKLDGKDAKAADLAAGQSATVTYTKSADQMTATQIVARVKPAPKAKAPTTPKPPKK